VIANLSVKWRDILINVWVEGYEAWTLDTDMSTLVIILQNDIIECNDMCRRRVLSHAEMCRTLCL